MEPDMTEMIIWKKRFLFLHIMLRGHHGRDCMVVGFTTTYAIRAYHHWCCGFDSRSGRGVQHLCDKVCQWLAAGQWFSLGPPISSTNKIGRHDINEILLKVALNTTKETNKHIMLILLGERLLRGHKKGELDKSLKKDKNFYTRWVIKGFRLIIYIYLFDGEIWWQINKFLYILTILNSKLHQWFNG